MKKWCVIFVVLSVVAYGVYDIVQEVRRAYVTVNSHTYSHALAQIVCPAFDSLKLDGRGIRIGVLDAGFGGFRTNAWTRNLRIAAWRDFTGGHDDALFDDAEPDHGTTVCARIGGFSGDTLRGLASGAEFLLAKTDCFEVEPRAEERQMIQGIEWLLSQEVDVISSSLNYTVFDDFQGYNPSMLDGRSSLISRYLDSLLAARPELVFVQSAGNNGDKAWKYIGFPADVRSVITVGSCDSDDTLRYRSSSIGRSDADYLKPDFVAYASPIGTSFSTPIITGLCACLLQYRRLERDELIEVLHASGTNAVAPDTQIGYGIPQTDILLKRMEDE